MAEEAAFLLYKKYHCDTFIQVDYLIEDEALAEKTQTIVNSALQKYGDRLAVDHFRLVESGTHIKVIFDLLYPADLQNQEEDIRQEVEKSLYGRKRYLSGDDQRRPATRAFPVTWLTSVTI